MLLSNGLSLTNEALAIALAKGVKHAARTFLGEIKIHAFQFRAPAGVAPWASADVLSGEFLFRVELHGDCRAALKTHAFDRAKLAKGVAKLAACDAAAFGRISEGKGKVADCVALLQLSLFGAEWFDSEA